MISATAPDRWVGIDIPHDHELLAGSYISIESRLRKFGPPPQIHLSFLCRLQLQGVNVAHVIMPYSST